LFSLLCYCFSKLLGTGKFLKIFSQKYFNLK
jgi:hypothetical protein